MSGRRYRPSIVLDEDAYLRLRLYWRDQRSDGIDSFHEFLQFILESYEPPSDVEGDD